MYETRRLWCFQISPTPAVGSRSPMSRLSTVLVPAPQGDAGAGLGAPAGLLEQPLGLLLLEALVAQRVGEVTERGEHLVGVAEGAMFMFLLV